MRGLSPEALGRKARGLGTTDARSLLPALCVGELRIESERDSEHHRTLCTEDRLVKSTAEGGSKLTVVATGQASNAGQSVGTTAPETLARQGHRGSAPDKESAAPGWPRLLSLAEAARYLGVSPWTARELVNAGSIPVTSIPRPQTARMHRRHPVHDSLRRLLIDRCDLDRLVETWKVSG
jgi:hypothetical protein